MQLSDRQQEIIDEFQFFDSWMDKYQYLIDLGKEAGTLLVDQFDMTEHRYQRAMTSFSALEPALASLAQAYRTPLPDGSGVPRSYDWVLTDYDFPNSPPAAWRETPLKAFAEALAEIGLDARLRYDAKKSIYRERGPVFDGTVRLVASPDRVPGDVRSWGAWCAPPDPRPHT